MAAVLERERYLAAALEAKAYVKANLFLGASNDWRFYTHSFAAFGPLAPAVITTGLGVHLAQQWAILSDSRSEGNAAQAAGRPYQKGSRRLTRAMMEIWSRDGLRFHCGNCGVQSAVAFVRLRDHWKVFPLDWIQVKQGDHGFVVVGRDGTTNAADPASWNDEAVVCDPWKNLVQPAKACQDLRSEVLELVYRQDSSQDIPRD